MLGTEIAGREIVSPKETTMYMVGWMVWIEGMLQDKILNWIFWSQSMAEEANFLTFHGTVIGPLPIEECQRLLSIYR